MSRKMLVTSNNTIGQITAICDPDNPDFHALTQLDGLELLASCPEICLKEICSVLSEDELLNIELDDLRYVLADAIQLNYLSGVACGSKAINEAVQQALLAAPAPLTGKEKLLVMFSHNSAFFELRDIKAMKKSIADNAGENMYFALSTIHNESLREGEVRVGILVSSMVTF